MQSIRTALLVVVLTLTQQLTAEAVGKDKNMTMVLEANGKTIVFLLNDSRASKDLMDQMPLTVKLADFGHNEKIFYPPKKLRTTGTPLATFNNAKAGTLAYYGPWGDVVLFFGDFSPASGLYVLGMVASGLESIATLQGSAQISIRTD